VPLLAGRSANRLFGERKTSGVEANKDVETDLSSNAFERLEAGFRSQ
jgi:hypothetical protein